MEENRSVWDKLTEIYCANFGYCRARFCALQRDSTSIMDIPSFNPSTFVNVAEGMLGKAVGLQAIRTDRRFRALFGVSPVLCSLVWNKFSKMLPVRGQPQHLLWSLLQLKVYSTEAVLVAIAAVDRKTFRKWSWMILDCLSRLPVVSRNTENFYYLIM